MSHGASDRYPDDSESYRAYVCEDCHESGAMEREDGARRCNRCQAKHALLEEVLSAPECALCHRSVAVSPAPLAAGGEALLCDECKASEARLRAAPAHAHPPSPHAANPWEQRSRDRKVRLLVSTLDEFLRGAGAEPESDAAVHAIEALTDAQWERLAREARVNLPSATTRAQVIDSYSRRLSAAAPARKVAR